MSKNEDINNAIRIKRAEKSYLRSQVNLQKKVSSINIQYNDILPQYLEQKINNEYDRLSYYFSELKTVPYMNSNMRYTTYGFVRKEIGIDKELFREFMKRHSSE